MTIIQATRQPMNLLLLGADVVANNGTSFGGPWTGTSWVRRLIRNQSGGVGVRHILPVTLTDHWYQFEFVCGNLIGSPARFLFYDASGNLLFYVGNSDAMPVRRWSGSGSTFILVGTQPAVSGGVVYTLGIRFKRDATAGIIATSLNGSEVTRFDGDTTVGSGGVRYVDYVNASIGSGANNTDYYSGFVISSGDEPPFGIKMADRVPTGTGNSSGFSPGTTGWQNVDDLSTDTSDVIAAASSPLVSTFAFDDPPSLSGSETIRGVYHSIYARGGSTGPTGIKQVLRASATDQMSTSKALVTGWKVYNEFFETNTVTSAEFTPSELAAGEIGVAT